MEIGKKVSDIELQNTFPADEGMANFYYGQIRSGKTYGATCDILDELRQGHVVYATWPINVKSFDDRDSFFLLLMNIVLFRKRFYKIPCSQNFHYINAETGEVDGIKRFEATDEGYIKYLNTLNHCSLYIDEAWRVIDSYKGSNFSLAGRNLILVTGHKFRTVNLIAQRPTSVHVTARANMNRFYKFVKIATWPWVRFARYEFQEMSGETVDETVDPISVKTYWGRKSVFDSYNSYYYGELEPVHKVQFEAYDLGFFDRIKRLITMIRGIRAGDGALKPQAPAIDDRNIRRIPVKSVLFNGEVRK